MAWQVHVHMCVVSFCTVVLLGVCDCCLNGSVSTYMCNCVALNAAAMGILWTYWTVALFHWINLSLVGF